MLNNQKLEKTIQQLTVDEYVVPIYQRNYAWKYDEIYSYLMIFSKPLSRILQEIIILVV